MQKKILIFCYIYHCIKNILYISVKKILTLLHLSLHESKCMYYKLWKSVTFIIAKKIICIGEFLKILLHISLQLFIVHSHMGFSVISRYSLRSHLITGELMLETKVIFSRLNFRQLGVLRSISKCAYDQYIPTCNAFRFYYTNASFDKISSTKFGKEICRITQVIKRNIFKIACQKWYQCRFD